MTGMELSRNFYETCGAPMLREQFPELLPLLAVGLVGSGSECFGYDDALSRDHDFEPGFCIFLPDEDVVSRQDCFRLERTYAKLPKEFLGFRRSLMNPAGGNRHGVFRTGDFYEAKTGSRDGDLTVGQWFSLPSSALAEATNGEVFSDGYGQFTRIREALLRMPEDIRKKKLAGHLCLMAQSGQYNYARCLDHGEPGAAQLAAVSFVQSAMSVIFLLNRRHQPFYKWSFRALRGLPVLPEIADPLERILSTGNDGDLPLEKQRLIHLVASAVAGQLTQTALSRAEGIDLGRHATSVNDGVADPVIRNADLLAAV